VAAGLRTVSVAPGLLATTKDAVRTVDLASIKASDMASVLAPSWWDRLRSGFSATAAKALFRGTPK
jgi:hypothetical protein